jgi:hypothetical protein
MEPVALGILLRLDVRGWAGPAPRLPKEPLKVEEGRDGLRSFVYDLSPSEPDLPVADACVRIASRLRRLLAPERSPFAEAHCAVRAVLEFGILADCERQSFAYSWPLEFLEALVDTEVELNVSHYLPSSEDDDDDA